MTRRPARAALATLVVFLLGMGLTACVPDRPGGAVSWLGGQSGIVHAEVLADNSGEFQSSGLVRGELAPNLSDTQIAGIAGAVRDYLASHKQVGIRLGRAGIDFAVGSDPVATKSVIALWNDVAKVPKLVNAVVFDGGIHARVLRPDAVTVLASLDNFGVDITLEAMTDAAAIAHDTTKDDFFGDTIFDIDSLALDWPHNCRPTGGERSLVESLFGRPEVGGGLLRLCSGFDIYYRVDASLATYVPALYTDLNNDGLLAFPVTVHQIVASAPDGHLVTVAPADPAAFGVLAAFETDAAPALYYTLAGDSSLDVTEYGTPTAELLGLVSASPTAASLPSIRIEGNTSAISGTLGTLALMLEQVTALVATSSIFTNVELGPTTGSLSLDSPVATDPDVVTAAQALRASGAWLGRAFTVSYISTSLTIVNGVATVDNPDYTDPHVVNAFVAAWQATAG